jgi:G6PDH family F420-dependent oxidoreductase
LPKPLISLDLGENYYDPRRFVEAVSVGEELGFRRLWLGDHFAPFFHSSHQSSFVWSVISSALERTNRVEIGPLVTTPIGARYHPALTAQAAATLDNMYPGRLLVGVGTGEAVNESSFWNDEWPSWSERIERLCEGVTLMKKLWSRTSPFSFDGKYFSSDFYFLYTRPRTNLEIYFSAVGEGAAYFAGRYADHLVTLSPANDPDRIRDILLPRFREGRREAEKTPGGRKKPRGSGPAKGRKNESGVAGGGSLVVHVDYSFRTPREVLRHSRKELSSFVPKAVDIKTPVELEKRAAGLREDRLEKFVHFCRGWGDLVKTLELYVEVGAQEIILFSAPAREEIESVAQNVLSVF